LGYTPPEAIQHRRHVRHKRRAPPTVQHLTLAAPRTVETASTDQTPAQSAVRPAHQASTPGPRYSYSALRSLPVRCEGSMDDVGPSLATRLGYGHHLPLVRVPRRPRTGQVGLAVPVAVGGYPPSGEQLVTFRLRFEYREDGDGHHVVICREGKLSRCEDEVRASTLSVFRLTPHTWTHCSCVCLSAHKVIQVPRRGLASVVIQEDANEVKLLMYQVLKKLDRVLGALSTTTTSR
jgi:hypothetical protein